MAITKRAFSAIFVSLLLVASSFADDAKATTLTDRIHAEAVRILAAARHSEYSHKTVIDEKEGVFNLDCSGFVDVVLKKVSPKHLAEIEKHRGNKRQLAEDYVDAFEMAHTTEGSAWKRIARVADARPGDILCWRNPLHKDGDHLNTGHVMIIDEPPVPEGDPSQMLYRVVIVDSTATPHASDTRKEGASGLGRGTLWLKVDKEGKPIGYHWKIPTGEAKEYIIAIGRAE